MKTQGLLIRGLFFCLSIGGIQTVTAEVKDNLFLVSYFSTCLSSEKLVPFEQDKQFRPSQTEHYRQLVWDAWKTANTHFAEEKLIPLNKLSETSCGNWSIPQTLEPNATMPYYYGIKGETKPEYGYPLFIYLHGSGPKSHEWKTGLLLCQSFNDAPSVCFIPQIPNEGKYYRWWQKSKQYAWEKLLRQVLATEEIDPDRIYMFGISEGAYGSQRLASFYADYLAGAGPMAGGEPLKNAPVENCANIAFSLLTGANDKGFYRNVLTNYAQEKFKSLQASHPDFYQHRIELIPDKGHAIDYQLTTPWLKQFSRNPYPKYFCWEDFEMDGVHRHGFYNLLVKERPGEKRTRYEMAIEGNRITMNIDEVEYETTEKDPNWGIELKFRKTFTPVTEGHFVIYLCQELVDLGKPVTIVVNGKQVFKAKVKTNLSNMVNSCTAFFDPRRIYPAAVEINL